MEKDWLVPLRRQSCRQWICPPKSSDVEWGDGENPLSAEWQKQAKRKAKLVKQTRSSPWQAVKWGEELCIFQGTQRNPEHCDTNCWVSWNWSTLLQEWNAHLLTSVLILWNIGLSFAWTWGPPVVLQLGNMVQLLLKVKYTFCIVVQPASWFFSKKWLD